jgi:prophage DNA circulation protein
MSQISDVKNPWRDILLGEPASFRGVIFHVETGGRSSGRRGVIHEYPKRNDPYAEDMGLVARRFQISGYLVYRPRKDFETNPLLYDYVDQRKKLYEALEADDVGKLVHPVFAPGGIQALCERYSMTEGRERGGYTQFEMQFVETGRAVSSAGVANTKASVAASASSAEKTALDLMPSDI